MRREMCDCTDPNIFKLNSKNYGIETTLAIEWEFVVDPDGKPSSSVLFLVLCGGQSWTLLSPPHSLSIFSSLPLSVSVSASPCPCESL